MISIRLIKQGKPDTAYPATLLSDDGNHLVARAPWFKPTIRDFGFVRFEPGDVFTEHFFRDRWYSVKEVRTATGELKGWYCDIARPAAVGGDTVTVEDLDLDLWVSADGKTVLRLDEDEFADSGLAARDPEAAALAAQALDTLEALATARGPEWFSAL